MKNRISSLISLVVVCLFIGTAVHGQSVSETSDSRVRVNGPEPQFIRGSNNQRMDRVKVVGPETQMIQSKSQTTNENRLYFNGPEPQVIRNQEATRAKVVRRTK